MLRFVAPILLAVICVAFLKPPAESPDNKSSALTPVVFRRVIANEEKAQQEYDSLQAQFNVSMGDFTKRIKTIKDKSEQVRLIAAENPAREFAQRFMALAKRYPQTKSAVNSVLFAVGQPSGTQKNEAMIHLIQNYSDKVRLDKMAESFKEEVPSAEIENWYLSMCENATGDSIRASVMFDYAKYVSQIPVFRSTLSINPAVAARLSKTQLDYINAKRTPEQDAKVAKALQTIIDELPNVKKGRSTYAQLAKRELFDLVRLQVGQKAPDIVGKDLDGVDFRLSNYRCKVVLLDFWGHWCPPCRAMYPDERAITRELADKPFVLIGVNSDRNLETARSAVARENLSWRHFWVGPKDPMVQSRISGTSRAGLRFI